MARWDFIKSLAELDAFIFAEADENGHIPLDAFGRLTGVYPIHLQFDLLDIRSELTRFLLERGVIGYRVFDEGIRVSEMFLFISYYSRDGREGFTHLTSRDGYARAKRIYTLRGVKEHLAKFRP